MVRSIMIILVLVAVELLLLTGPVFLLDPPGKAPRSNIPNTTASAAGGRGM